MIKALLKLYLFEIPIMILSMTKVVLFDDANIMQCDYQYELRSMDKLKTLENLYLSEEEMEQTDG